MKDIWIDIKRPADVKIDSKMNYLPPILRTAAKDLVRNMGDVAKKVKPPLYDKVKAYRVIENRCVKDLKTKARVYYRRKHPPPFECVKCSSVFMFSFQLESHGTKTEDCAAKEFKSQGYAWYMTKDFVGRVMETVMKVFYADIWDG